MCPLYQGSATNPHLPTGPPREVFLDSPKALAIEAGLVGCPGGVPACVLLRVGAAYLVRGDSAGLKAQGLVVGALCRIREKLRNTSGLVSCAYVHTCCRHPLWFHCSLSFLTRMLGMLFNPTTTPAVVAAQGPWDPHF